MSEIVSSQEASSKSSVESDFWNRCGDLRPELTVPGIWTCLEENCCQWASEVDVSPFWKAVIDRQPAWSNEFTQQTAGGLLMSAELPKFLGKGEERIRSKSFDCARDRDSHTPRKIWPVGGPPVPMLNDLVRTRVVCQFVDGVEFLSEKLDLLATELGIPHSRFREGRLEGYFAQHFYFDQNVFFRFNRTVNPTTIKCEVQVATGLATTIQAQVHTVYSKWRGQREKRDDWQWNPKDPRYIARQLGHMMHLADGLLVQLRDAAIPKHDEK